MQSPVVEWENSPVTAGQRWFTVVEINFGLWEMVLAAGDLPPWKFICFIHNPQLADICVQITQE